MRFDGDFIVGALHVLTASSVPLLMLFRINPPQTGEEGTLVLIFESFYRRRSPISVTFRNPPESDDVRLIIAVFDILSSAQQRNTSQEYYW